MIQIDMTKAKEIGHTIRRAKRAAEFEPLDAVIAKQIPGIDTVAVEAQRQYIRDKYAVIQNQIDSSQEPSEIKSALGIGEAS
jgi:hypothetical protein